MGNTTLNIDSGSLGIYSSCYTLYLFHVVVLGISCEGFWVQEGDLILAVSGSGSVGVNFAITGGVWTQNGSVSTLISGDTVKGIYILYYFSSIVILRYYLLPTGRYLFYHGGCSLEPAWPYLYSHECQQFLWYCFSPLCLLLTVCPQESIFCRVILHSGVNWVLFPSLRSAAMTPIVHVHIYSRIFTSSLCLSFIRSMSASTAGSTERTDTI